MISLYELSFDELQNLLTTWEHPKFRAKQLWQWLYKNKASSFEEMHTLPAPLREQLAAETHIGTLEIVTERRAKDSTVKRLYRLPDGALIESVLMPYDDGRRTACISTQAGCAMGCVFCATGQMGFSRNLNTAEIVEQALHFARLLESEGERLSNIVLMGMGEPLHNYDATLKAIHLMIASEGLAIGQRHITLSTVGLVPSIRRFADEGLQVKLAISLHAATDEERDALLPINKKWNLTELMDACRYYIEKTNRRVTFEWALIHEENDTPEQAHTLGKLLEGLMCHVNLIPLNPTNEYSGRPSNPERVDVFMRILGKYGISSSVRVRRGIEIDAGCGQLKAEILNQSNTTVFDELSSP